MRHDDASAFAAADDVLGIRCLIEGVALDLGLVFMYICSFTWDEYITRKGLTLIGNRMLLRNDRFLTNW